MKRFINTLVLVFSATMITSHFGVAAANPPNRNDANPPDQPCRGMMCERMPHTVWKVIFTQTDKAVSREGLVILSNRYPNFFEGVELAQVQSASLQWHTATFRGKHTCPENDPRLTITYPASKEICYPGKGHGHGHQELEICSASTMAPPPTDPCAQH